MKPAVIRATLAILFATCTAPWLHAQQAPATAAASNPPAITVPTIVRDPSDLPPPIGLRSPQAVRVVLTAEEVVAPLDPAAGVAYAYWTFNGKIPGPLVRVRVGDTVEVTLRNNAANRMVHSIDLHAALGPGGGAAMMQVTPGQEKTFSFVATTPGLFVYHCGTPTVAEHIANGMYGLILVEPAPGLAPVSREYYIMQGEIYTPNAGKRGDTLAFDNDRMLAESPQYVVFNGAVGALTQQHPLAASVGQSVRIFFGNAGPSLTSSPHMIGEIFTHYFPFGSLSSPPIAGVQTATVPPGSAAIMELQARMPGQFAFMDHAIARMQKGLVAYMNVTGRDVARLMLPGPDEFQGPIPPLAITPADAADAFLADAAPPAAPTPAAAQPAFHTAVATTTVTMTDKAFLPAVIEIRAGQAVTWRNASAVIHTVGDDAGVALVKSDVSLPAGAQAFASPFLLSGQSATYVFPVPGVYHYVCTQHERDGMLGTIIVKPVAVNAKHPRQ